MIYNFFLGTDCKTLYDNGVRQDGVYTINPDGLGAFDVYCELDPNRSDGTSEGGWTVIQRRVDDSVDFSRWVGNYYTHYIKNSAISLNVTQFDPFISVSYVFNHPLYYDFKIDWGHCLQ